MTDAATTEKIRRPRPTKYPAQISAMVTQETRDAIDDAVEDGRSQGDVIREWLDYGRRVHELVERAELVLERRDDASDAPVDADAAGA